jgi:hypothetical protein
MLDGFLWQLQHWATGHCTLQIEQIKQWYSCTLPSSFQASSAV